MSGEVITSRQNPLVKHLRRLGADRGYRTERGEFLCDGHKLLEEAVRCGSEVTCVLYAGDLPDNCGSLPLQRAVREIVDYVSPLKNAQGVIFSCRMTDRAEAMPAPGRHIVLEGLQDPGNVGAVMRTASAFGIDGVILVDCVDVYNPKTVRASMGAVFRQRVFELGLEKLPEAVENAGLTLCAAALGGECVDVRALPRENVAVAIGSEGSGLSGGLIGMSSLCIKIPMEPGCESLNAAVAAAVVMWEMTR